MQEGLPEAAHQAFRTCLEAMDHHPGLPQPDGYAFSGLVRELVRLICGDAQLQRIYAGHAVADAAYLKRILG